MSQLHHSRRRAWLWTLLALVVVAGAFRLALNPLARHFTQRALDSREGYRGQFEDLSLSVLSLRYQLGGLTLVRDPARGHQETVYAKKVEARLAWPELWHRRLAGSLRVDDAKVTYELTSRAQLHDAIVSGEAFADRPDLGGLIEGLVPFRITRVEVRHSEALVIDRTEKGVPEKTTELWLHDIEATVENFGSRNALLHGEPTTLAMEAELQRSGAITLFVTLDPLADKLDLEGEASVRHLPLEDLYGFLVALTELQPKSGALDAFATFRCNDGYVDGAIKPMLATVELAPTQTGAGNQVRATLGNAAVSVAADKTPQHEVATILPFGGRVTDPKPQLWPALLTLLGSPLAPGYAPLPAASAKGGAKDGAKAATKDAARDGEKPPAPKATAPASMAAHLRKSRPGQPPLSTSPQGVLERGALPKIAAALSAQGFAAPASDTLAGPIERELLRFQLSQGLPGTGFPDRETLRQLGLDAESLYRSNRD